VTKSAAIVAIVNSALALLLAFGVSLSDDQQLAIIGAVNAALVLIAAWHDPKVPFGAK
jgi:uncharacterized membrane protein